MQSEAEGGSIDLPQIVEGALTILRAEPEQSMLMSALGLSLTRQFGPSLKAVLGDKKLRTVLTSALGDAVVFSGHTTNLSVRLIEAPTHRAGRFDAAVWAAFAKPVPEGKSRYITVSKPVDFRDLDVDEAPEAGWRKIEATSVPPSEMPKPDREAAITSAIYKFAEDIGVPVSTLLFETRSRKPPSASRESDPSNSQRGVAALLQMIELVPPQERQAYHLSLDLIYRLLKQ